MIDAKLVNAAGKVTTIRLQDDPSDADLIKALGGGPAIVTRGVVGAWEALRIAGTSAPTLVIGAAPYLHAQVKQRQTCNLPDAKVQALVTFIDHWL